MPREFLHSYRAEGRNILTPQERDVLARQVLRLLRRGISQSEIARHAGIHPSNVSRLVTGRSKLTVAYGLAIARAAKDLAS